MSRPQALGEIKFTFYQEGVEVFSKCAPYENDVRAYQEYKRAAGLLGLTVEIQLLPDNFWSEASAACGVS